MYSYKAHFEQIRLLFYCECLMTVFICFFFKLVSVSIVNVVSVRLAARTQQLFSVIKVGGLLVIIGGGIYSMFKRLAKVILFNL